jgi:hypothetical protein
LWGTNLGHKSIVLQTLNSEISGFESSRHYTKKLCSFLNKIGIDFIMKKLDFLKKLQFEEISSKSKKYRVVSMQVISKRKWL